jgi:hypothetical protein
LLTVQRNYVMQDFVYQAHGIYLSGSHSLPRVSDEIAPGVHLLCEQARGPEIRKDHVAIGGKNCLVKLVAFARLA